MVTVQTRRSIIYDMIRDGYGVEDIAVMKGYPLHVVHCDVDEMRRTGLLVKPKAILADRAREMAGER